MTNWINLEQNIYGAGGSGKTKLFTHDLPGQELLSSLKNKFLDSLGNQNTKKLEFNTDLLNLLDSVGLHDKKYEIMHYAPSYPGKDFYNKMPVATLTAIKQNGWSGTLNDLIDVFGVEGAQIIFANFDLGLMKDENDTYLVGLKMLKQDGAKLVSPVFGHPYPEPVNGVITIKEPDIDKNPKIVCSKGIHLGNLEHIQNRDYNGSLFRVTVPSNAYIVIPEELPGDKYSRDLRTSELHVHVN